jgi:hypothetical protein
MSWFLRLLRTPRDPWTTPTVPKLRISGCDIDEESHIKSYPTSESCNTLRELLRAGLLVGKFPNSMTSQAGEQSYDENVSNVAPKRANFPGETRPHGLNERVTGPASTTGGQGESLCQAENEQDNDSETSANPTNFTADTASDISDTLSYYLQSLRTDSPSKASSTSHPSSITSTSPPPSPSQPKPSPYHLYTNADLLTLPNTILETEYVKFSGDDFLLRQLDLKQQAERHCARLIDEQTELHDKINDLQQLIFEFQRRELRLEAEITGLKRKLVQERMQVTRLRAVPGVWVPMEQRGGESGV